ncbi:MAG TPA: phosphatase PAP2 family protein [Ktedonobacteraceae bacterium]|nr:phosphatase PAP2 family protein [Ktedonobacteraceae bacterium]
MPDIPHETEQREPLAQQENVQDKDAPKSITEGTQETVQKARQDVAAARLPWYHIIKRGYFLLGIYALLVVLFALLATFVHFHPILGIDVTITHEFQESQNPWLVAFMTFVSYPGSNTLLSIVLVLLVILIFWLIDLRLEAATIAVVYSVSALLNAAIKLLVGRPRPGAKLVDVFYTVTGNSFPSGHVMSYVALWGLLFTFGVILFSGHRWWRIALLIVSAFFVVMVGPSRIYLGAHWATDVLGAYLIGGALLGISLLIFLKLNQRGVLAPRKEHTWLSARKFAGSRPGRPPESR